MATTVRITETYDMKTTVGKIGLVGIHTPSPSLLNKLYPGLMRNHRFIRFKRCDVVGACASVLPADPLQVGVTAGAVAPEDMFNPILYKAVTNSSFDTIMARLYGQPDLSTGSLCRNDMDVSGVTSEATQFDMYYGLLASKGWRKAMPQAGFRVKGLIPICHTLISTYGNLARPNNFNVVDADTEAERLVPNVADVNTLNDNGVVDTTEAQAITFRGKSVKMPRLPLHVEPEGLTAVPQNPVLPKTFVMALVTPPARLHEFFYRVRVSWVCSFEEVIPLTEFGGYTSVLASAGQTAHASNYTYETSKADLSNVADMSDAEGVDINKIMES